MTPNFVHMHLLLNHVRRSGRSSRSRAAARRAKRSEELTRGALALSSPSRSVAADLHDGLFGAEGAQDRPGVSADPSFSVIRAPRSSR